MWRIGDGSTVNIHHDPWILRQGSLLPLGAVFIPGIQKVADLLNHTGETWDDTKLHAMFSSDEATDIKQIVVGGPGAHDYITWNYTKNGIFTVKSAYHLRMAMNAAKEASQDPLRLL